MPVINFITYDNKTFSVDGKLGDSVMQVALDNMVPGIVGDCGGSCSCATCHAYVDPEWADRLPSPSEDEKLMLEGVTVLEANSRLSCQVNVTSDLDGIIFRLPESQY